MLTDHAFREISMVARKFVMSERPRFTVCVVAIKWLRNGPFSLRRVKRAIRVPMTRNVVTFAGVFQNESFANTGLLTTCQDEQSDADVQRQFRISAQNPRSPDNHGICEEKLHKNRMHK